MKTRIIYLKHISGPAIGTKHCVCRAQEGTPDFETMGDVNGEIVGHLMWEVEECDTPEL